MFMNRGLLQLDDTRRDHGVPKSALITKIFRRFRLEAPLTF
jgi:hypothetical protein